MKTKVFLTSFALAAATGSMFVACNNEDFVTENSGSIEQSGMIELSENFMIGAVGADNTSTRTHWQLKDGALTNVFSPIATSTNGNNSIPVTGGTSQLVVAPSIGLCWIGNGGAGEQVYTNYEFFHNGWLGKAQESAIFDPCNESILTNGWLYSDLTLAATVADGVEAVSDLTKVTAADKEAADGTTLKVAEMNLNSGVYKTCNKAIFGGQYIAYYPYNKNFKDAGAIPATSVVEFNDMKKNDATDFQLSNNTFRYSNVAAITGGQQAQGFGFHNLSGVVRIVLKGASDLNNKITKIMLYSKSSSFVKEVLLSPAKIAAGATGTELYSKVVSTNKTILVNMADGQELAVTKAGGDNSKVYLTALPAKISDLVVMVQDKDEMWAECEIGNFEIVAGEGRELVATYAKDDFKQVYYAVDQTTLEAAIAKCNAAGLSATKKATIEVLGDITLEGNVTVPAFVTIDGDKVIVPQDVTLTLDDNSAVKSDVVVEGKSCCTGNNGGILSVAGATINGNVSVTAGEATPAKAGQIKFTAPGAVVAATSVIESEGNVDFANNSNVAIYGTLTLAENVKATVAESAVVAVKGGIINNDGTFEVLGDFSMLDAQGTTVASAGKNFKNNGTFIDNVGSKVGGATQYMTFGENGDYICKVDGENRMNEAYENKTACSTIEIINNSQNFTFAKVQQHNGKDVNIVVSATGTTFDPAKAVTIGNLTINSSKDLTVNTTKAIKDSKGNVTGYAAITVNGNLNAKGDLTLAENVRNMQINGDITVAAKFAVEKDVRNMTADNLTVIKGGSATFANRVDSQDKTLEVSNTIEVQKGGTFTIGEKTAGQNIAYVTCTKLVEGGTFNGKPNVVE